MGQVVILVSQVVAIGKTKGFAETEGKGILYPLAKGLQDKGGSLFIDRCVCSMSIPAFNLLFSRALCAEPLNSSRMSQCPVDFYICVVHDLSVQQRKGATPTISCEPNSVLHTLIPALVRHMTLYNESCRPVYPKPVARPRLWNPSYVSPARPLAETWKEGHLR